MILPNQPITSPLSRAIVAAFFTKLDYWVTRLNSKVETYHSQDITWVAYNAAGEATLQLRRAGQPTIVITHDLNSNELLANFTETAEEKLSFFCELEQLVTAEINDIIDTVDKLEAQAFNDN